MELSYFHLGPQSLLKTAPRQTWGTMNPGVPASCLGGNQLLLGHLDSSEAGQLPAPFPASGEFGNVHNALKLCANYVLLKGSLNAFSQSPGVFFVQKNTFVIK